MIANPCGSAHLRSYPCRECDRIRASQSEAREDRSTAVPVEDTVKGVVTAGHVPAVSVDDEPRGVARKRAKSEKSVLTERGMRQARALKTAQEIDKPVRELERLDDVGFVDTGGSASTGGGAAGHAPDGLRGEPVAVASSAPPELGGVGQKRSRPELEKLVTDAVEREVLTAAARAKRYREKRGVAGRERERLRKAAKRRGEL